MSTVSTASKITDFQTTQFISEEVPLQHLFDKQKAYFATDVTKTFEWRVDQLDRLIRMLKDNYERFANASRDDFKTASQENVFEVSASIASTEFTKSQLKEWMRPVEAPLPKFLAASGHKGIVYREPYGVTLIICPFNGPLLLSLRPVVAAVSAGNPCILKLSEAPCGKEGQVELGEGPEQFSEISTFQSLRKKQSITSASRLKFNKTVT